MLRVDQFVNYSKSSRGNRDLDPLCEFGRQKIFSLSQQRFFPVRLCAHLFIYYLFICINAHTSLHQLSYRHRSMATSTATAATHTRKKSGLDRQTTVKHYENEEETRGKKSYIIILRNLEILQRFYFPDPQFRSICL
jgi:hypothetical protein